MNEYLDFLAGPQGTNDPMSVLRKAQEKLRQEEEAKAALEELLTKKMSPERFSKAEAQIAQTPANAALDKLIARVEQTGPLDRAAQLSPQEIEREMYERIWGAPAKSKLGKVGKGISDVIGTLGGVPRDFSKPAMEQFLKIQQQQRMAQTADLNALSSAANTTQRTGAAQQKSLLDLQKLMNLNEGQIMKHMTDRFRNENTAKYQSALTGHYERMDANAKEKLRLEGEELKKKFAANPYGFAQELEQMSPQKQAAVLQMLDMTTTLMGANKGGPSGASSTTTTVRDTMAQNEFGNPVKGPQMMTTSTRQGGGGNAVNQQRANEIRQQLAQRLGMPGPIGPTPMPPQGAPTTNLGSKPGKIEKSESVMDSPQVSGEDSFRLANPGFSNTFKNAAGGDAFKALRQQTGSAYEISSRLLKGIENGYIKDVMGPKNQPIETLGRVLEAVKIPGKDVAAHAQGAWNDITGKYKDTWDKQKLYEDVTRERVNLISQKVLEMSGRAASDKERAFLQSPYVSISDEPMTATHKMLRLSLRLGVLTRMRELGIADNLQPEVLSRINEYLDDQADGLLNRSRQRATNKLATTNTGKFDVSELNPDRILYGALKKGDLLGQFPQLRLEQAPARKPTQELKRKLRGLSLDEKLKKLGQ